MDTEVPLSTPIHFANLGFLQNLEMPLAIMLVLLGLCFAVLCSLFSYSLAAVKNIRAQQPTTAKALLGGLVAFLTISIACFFIGIKTSALLMFEQESIPLANSMSGLLAMAEIGNALWPPLLATVLGVVFGSMAKLGVGGSTRPIRQTGFILRKLSFGKLNIAASDLTPDADAEEPEFEITMASGDVVEAEEREYIENILELGDTTAQEVMRPRTDVVAMEVTTDVGEIIKLVADSRYSRFPVYEGSIDHVIGILHLRDLFELLARGDSLEQVDIRSIIHDCISIPASKKVDDAIKDLQAQQGQLAVVMDEFGGTAGILTIEDLLEEIVGEIQDEHDEDAKQTHELSDGSKVISGQMSLDDLNELLDKTYDEEDVETLGGLVTAALGHIPSVHEFVELDHIKFTVLSMEKNRVGQVKAEV